MLKTALGFGILKDSSSYVVRGSNSKVRKKEERIRRKRIDRKAQWEVRAKVCSSSTKC